MIWKAIGSSIAGTSHLAVNIPCEDAIQYKVMQDANGEEALICCVSDGAGSALYGGWASAFSAQKMVDGLSAIAEEGRPVTETDIYALAEDIYYGLLAESRRQKTALPEYSCTLLGCIITGQGSAFFQVGDGAIVRFDNEGFYAPVWWPDNGEYQNYTSFICDDPLMGKLKVQVTEAEVTEVAIFTDGLQMLALRTEDKTAHQPFFHDLFRYLRMANTPENITALNVRLAEYLDSPQINNRTDDDKTLFLATRLT